MHLLDAEHACAQAEVAMQGRQRLVHFPDQRVIDLGRQVVLVQFAVQHAVIVARFGQSNLSLDMRIQHHADGIAVFEPLAPERVEYQLTVVAVGAATGA